MEQSIHLREVRHSYCEGHDLEHYTYCRFKCTMHSNFNCKRQKCSDDGKSGSVCEISTQLSKPFFAQVEVSHRGCYHFEIERSCSERTAKFFHNGRKAEMNFCRPWPKEYPEGNHDHGDVDEHISFIVCFLTCGTSVFFASQPNTWIYCKQPCQLRWLDQHEIDGISVFKVDVNHGIFLNKPLCCLIQAYTQLPHF